MKKLIAVALVVIALATIPMLCAVAAGAYLLFAAPTIFGVMLITGGVMYVTKNIVIAVATLSLLAAGYFVFKATRNTEATKQAPDNAVEAINRQGFKPAA